MRTLPEKEKRFEAFFEDRVYLQYKNHLYNYLTRRRVIRRMIHGNHFRQTLELGCGISPMTQMKRGVVPTDLSWQALSFLKRSSPEVSPVACDATRLPFQDESFDCVICSEVIEHIGRDDLVLHEISRVLKRGGDLYLTAPLHQKYFGFDDEFVGHYRRYEVADLKNLLKQSGLIEMGTLPVMGKLEKWIMEKVTRLFSLKGRGEGQNRHFWKMVRFLAFLFFPVYLVLNWVLAFIIGWQARAARSLDEIVNLCLHYRKAG